MRHECELKPDNRLSGTPATCDNQASNGVVSSYEPLIIQGALMQ